MTLSHDVRILAAALWIAATFGHPLIAADVQPKISIAVLPFQLVTTDGKVVAQSDSVAHGLEDTLLAGLSENSLVKLVERADLEKGIKERNLTVTDLADAVAAANAGLALKADLIVVGRIRTLGKEFNATVRVIACKNNEVMSASEIQGDAASLAGQMTSMADEIASAIPRMSHRAQTVNAVDPQQASLEALKHHERARSRKTSKAFEEAATEELLALSADKSLSGADEGFLDALAKAGFSELARAEARSRIQQDPASAGNASLRELANAPDSNKPVAAPAPESLKIDAGKRLAEWFDQKVAAGVFAARRDACLAWMTLGAQYAEEGRDALAIQAYRQGMTRVRLLRSMDPGTLGDWSLNFRDSHIPPAERLLEFLIYARYGRRSYSPSQIEMKLWEDVLRTPVLPEVAVQSLPIYEFQVPIVDHVYLPSQFTRTENQTQQNEYDFLFQIDWTALPPGMIALSAGIRSKDQLEWQFSAVQLIQQRWVGAEATAVFARKGVPWIADIRPLHRTLSGRNPQLSNPMSLTEAISVSMAQQHHANGFLCAKSTDTSRAFTAMQISAAFPPGKQPAGAKMDVISHVEAGLLAYLKGDKKSAATEWKAARDLNEALRDPRQPDYGESQFWAWAIGMCEGAKP